SKAEEDGGSSHRPIVPAHPAPRHAGDSRAGGATMARPCSRCWTRLGCSWSPARAGPARRRSRPGSPWPRRGGGGGGWSPRGRGGRGWRGGWGGGALRAARCGGRVVEHSRMRVAEGVNGLAIDPDESLREYLARYGFAPLARLLSWANLNRFITAAAPGLGDVLLVGKVWEAATREARP